MCKQTRRRTAALEAGGIRLDGVFYTHDELCDLPEGCKPHNVQEIVTDKGELAFAGEWSPFSNMFMTKFRYGGTTCTSAEQCYQHEKARYHNRLSKANKILLTNDPF